MTVETVKLRLAIQGQRNIESLRSIALDLLGALEAATRGAGDEGYSVVTAAGDSPWCPPFLLEPGPAGLPWIIRHPDALGRRG